MEPELNDLDGADLVTRAALDGGERLPVAVCVLRRPRRPRTFPVTALEKAKQRVVVQPARVVAVDEGREGRAGPSVGPSGETLRRQFEEALLARNQRAVIDILFG